MSLKRRNTSSTSTVLEKSASQAPGCCRAQHREGKERKTVAKLHLHHLQAMNLLAREGLGWAPPSSPKVLLDTVLANSCVVSGGGGRPEKMQGHQTTS